MRCRHYPNGCVPPKSVLGSTQLQSTASCGNLESKGRQKQSTQQVPFSHYQTLPSTCTVSRPGHICASPPLIVYKSQASSTTTKIRSRCETRPGNKPNCVHEDRSSDWIWGMLPILCVPISSLKIKRLKYTELWFYLFLHGYGTWPLTLEEKHRFRMYENRVLRRIFGPKREEVAGGWRRLRNEELHNLYTLLNITKVNISRLINGLHM
jgi:hypothetical protein